MRFLAWLISVNLLKNKIVRINRRKFHVDITHNSKKRSRTEQHFTFHSCSSFSMNKHKLKVTATRAHSTNDEQMLAAGKYKKYFNKIRCKNKNENRKNKWLISNWKCFNDWRHDDVGDISTLCVSHFSCSWIPSSEVRRGRRTETLRPIERNSNENETNTSKRMKAEWHERNRNSDEHHKAARTHNMATCLSSAIRLLPSLQSGYVFVRNSFRCRRMKPETRQTEEV